MTNKEIIKALECCGKNHITGSTDACEHCFLQNSAMCVTELIYKALDLINRQQAENERLSSSAKQWEETAKDLLISKEKQQAEIEKLNVELVGMRGACNSYKKHYDNAKAEIERLNIRLRKEQHQFEDLGKMYSGIRAEAIKEFAERLKEKAPIIEGLYFKTIKPISCATIDNLVKEMVGE